MAAEAPRRNRRRGIRRVLVGGFVFASAVLLVAAWIAGTEATHAANRPIGLPPAELSAEQLTIASESGKQIAAWYSQQANSTATIILLHPIRGSRKSMVERALMLRQHSYSTLLVDLQAHGESPGEHITMGHLERLDVQAAVRFLRARTPGQKIGIIGWSLGGASALLAEVDVDAMILESVFPTFIRAVHNRVQMRLGFLHHALAPLLWLQFRPRLGISVRKLRPLDHIASLQCPVLILAGDVDQRCTVEESRKLFEHAKEPKQWLLLEGARHEDLFRFDPETYSKSVLQFLDESLRN